MHINKKKDGIKMSDKLLAVTSFTLTLIILFVGFFHQFEVGYSDYKRIKPVGGEGFYPSGYSVYHTEKEFLGSALYFYDGKEITQAMDMDFSKYSYVMVQGAKVKRMYYSIKSTLFDDESPSYAKARRFWKWCLFIEYQEPDKYMYIYQIDKNTRLRGFHGC